MIAIGAAIGHRSTATTVCRKRKSAASALGQANLFFKPPRPFGGHQLVGFNDAHTADYSPGLASAPVRQQGSSGGEHGGAECRGAGSRWDGSSAACGVAGELKGNE